MVCNWKINTAKAVFKHPVLLLIYFLLGRQTGILKQEMSNVCKTLTDMTHSKPSRAFNSKVSRNRYLLSIHSVFSHASPLVFLMLHLIFLFHLWGLNSQHHTVDGIGTARFSVISKRMCANIFQTSQKYPFSVQIRAKAECCHMLLNVKLKVSEVADLSYWSLAQQS